MSPSADGRPCSPRAQRYVAATLARHVDNLWKTAGRRVLAVFLIGESGEAVVLIGQWISHCLPPQELLQDPRIVEVLLVSVLGIREKSQERSWDQTGDLGAVDLAHAVERVRPQLAVQGP